MATDDQVRRLILEVIGEDKVRGLREEIEKEEASLRKLASTLPELTAEELANDKGVQRATEHLIELNEQLGKVSTSKRNTGQAALELSRGLEDLQYGFAGVVNNIPGIVASLGGPAGLVAVFSLVGIGINQLINHWSELTRLLETKTPFPQATHDVDSLKHSLENAKKEMRGLQDHTSLTSEELTRFNDLRTRTAEIEHRIGEEQQRQHDLKVLEEARPEGEIKQDRERAQLVTEAIAPEKENLRKVLADRLRSEAQEEITRLGREITRVDVERTPAEQASLFQRFARHEKLRSTAQERADETIGAAMARGDRAALQRIRGVVRPESMLGFQLAEASPEGFDEKAAASKDVEDQKKMHKLNEDLQKKSAKEAEDKAKFREQAWSIEEADLRLQHQEGERTRQAEKKAETEENQAAQKREREAKKIQREIDARARQEAPS